MEERNISHPAEPMRVGSLVRWPEYPDRLYFVKEMPISHVGRNDYAKIESIDHKWGAVLPISELVLDDVDYDETKDRKMSAEEKLMVIRDAFEKSFVHLANATYQFEGCPLSKSTRLLPRSQHLQVPVSSKSDTNSRKTPNSNTVTKLK